MKRNKPKRQKSVLKRKNQFAWRLDPEYWEARLRKAGLSMNAGRDDKLTYEHATKMALNFDRNPAPASTMTTLSLGPTDELLLAERINEE